MTDGKDLTGRILKTAKEAGADLVTVADTRIFSDSGYTGKHPAAVWDQASAIILIAVPVPRGAFLPLPAGRGIYTNTLMAGTATLRVIAYRIARLIEAEGFLASIAPSEGSEFGYWYADRTTLMADFSMKYAAYRTGMGSFGKNHLLITDAYGSRVRLTAVLTNAPLITDTGDRPFLHQACQDCSACIDACPVQAIRTDGSIARDRCAEYMFTALGGLRCGLCIRACPLSAGPPAQRNDEREGRAEEI